MSGVSKAEVERELIEAWEALKSAVESFSDEEMFEPGVVQEWSVKDLLGHIAFWAGKAANDLKAVAAGRADEVLTPGDEAAVDAWNASEAERRKGLPLAAVREEWQSSFRAAKQALEAAPAEALDQVVVGWSMLRRFAGDTYEHYREHAEQIRAWQRQLETTEA